MEKFKCETEPSECSSGSISSTMTEDNLLHTIPNSQHEAIKETRANEDDWRVAGKSFARTRLLRAVGIVVMLLGVCIPYALLLTQYQKLQVQLGQCIPRPLSSAAGGPSQPATIPKTGREKYRVDNMRLASDINGLVPEVGHVFKTFWNDSYFVPAQDVLDRKPYDELMSQIDTAWLTLYPYRVGFIVIPDHEKYNLPLQMINEEGNLSNEFGVSAFHGLHCLYMLMRSNIRYFYDLEQLTTEDHLLHCFDYLRLSIMCHADLALEGSDPYHLAGSDRMGTLGLGSTHVCRDWDALYDWVSSKESTSGANNSSDDGD